MENGKWKMSLVRLPTAVCFCLPASAFRLLPTAHSISPSTAPLHRFASLRSSQFCRPELARQFGSPTLLSSRENGRAAQPDTAAAGGQGGESPRNTRGAERLF